MTNEQADLLNSLVDIEDRIDELWDFHPENPKGIDVIEEFERLQQLATVIQSQLSGVDSVNEDIF